MQMPASLKQEYERMSTDRSPYLERARDASKYTIATLVPPAGKHSGGRLRHGYSNFGARCVNNRAAKYLMALLPARQAFFRYHLEQQTLEQLGEKLQAQTEAALAKVEDAIQTDIETTPTRSPLNEAIKHILVAGNVLLYDLPDGGLKYYPIHSYVVERDGNGTWTRLVAEDHMSRVTLPPRVRAIVDAAQGGDRNPDKTITVYTGVYRTPTNFKVWQEVLGKVVPGSEGTYPLDACPWMPLRGIHVDGESYGRSPVEDYLGYFISLEGLTASLVKGSAAMAKLVYLRNPNGTTRAQVVARAETGDVVDGRVEDVQPLQSNKAADFREVRGMIQDLKEELSFAFGLSSAVQRNAERVTAEEIRRVAQELDLADGGSYSAFAQDFQLPLLKSRQRRLQRLGRLPAIPGTKVKPMIVTGLDALGRGAELENLRAFVSDVVELGGPEALQTYLNFGDLLQRLTTARGIKGEGLVKSQDEVAAANEQQRIQQLVQHLGPNAVNQMGQLAKAGMPPAINTPTA